MILVDLAAVGASRPDKPLFEGLSLTISAGDRVGVVGINGSGKSTLLRVIAGISDPETGEVRRRRGLTVSTLWQRPELGGTTVAEAVGDVSVDLLSGGQAKRVALARALLDDSVELLVLDEPTNHLDLAGIEWLEATLVASSGALVVVSHDRRFLDRVTTRLVGLERGRVRVVDGGYQAYLAAVEEDDRLAARAEASRRTLARQELAWLQRGARARRRKPKARLDVAHETLTETREDSERSRALAIDAFGASRLGRRVIDLHDVTVGRGDGPPLLSDVNLSIAPGARLGVVGPNGAGKSTLLDVIAGRLEPRAGRVERGTTVRLGYVDQLGETLAPQLSVADVIAGPGNGLERSQVELLERFWFEPDAHRSAVGLLSGGEQRRLQLLATLATEPNVLLLDEPTNDLDLDTLRALEGWLDDWSGSLVAVTHDRVFLERALDEVVAVGGGGLRRLGAGDAVWQEARTAPTGGGGVTARRSSGGRTRSSPDRGRSSSTLRHLLARADEELAAAQDRHDTLAARLDETRDREELARVGAELEEAAEDLRAAEERWLELAAEAEDGGHGEP